MTLRRENGMTPAVARLMEVADGTRTRLEVAVKLGYTKNGLCATVHQARLQGQRPLFRGGNRRREPSGIVTDLIGGLHPKVQEWFASQIPEGASELDLVRALILDAYHDEPGK
jgi:hypothetical protein